MPGVRSSSAAVVFFFFQAEDGIRDDLVTGVQTCALPISPKSQTNRFNPSSRISAGRIRAGRDSAGRIEPIRLGFWSRCRHEFEDNHTAKEEKLVLLWSHPSSLPKMANARASQACRGKAQWIS